MKEKIIDYFWISLAKDFPISLRERQETRSIDVRSRKRGSLEKSSWKLPGVSVWVLRKMEIFVEIFTNFLLRIFLWIYDVFCISIRVMQEYDAFLLGTEFNHHNLLWLGAFIEHVYILYTLFGTTTTHISIILYIIKVLVGSSLLISDLGSWTFFETAVAP